MLVPDVLLVARAAAELIPFVVVLFVLYAVVWRMIVAPLVLAEYQFPTVPRIDIESLLATSGVSSTSTSSGDNKKQKKQKRELWQPNKDDGSPGGLGARVLSCFNPCTMEVLGALPVDSAASVQRKAQLARAAQTSWAQTSFAERRRVLRAFKQFILQNRDDIVRVSCMDTGKTGREAMLGEVMISLARIDFNLEYAEKLLQRERRPVSMLAIHKQAYVEYVPYGIIGLIVPSNFPFQNVVSHALDALTSGNSCLVKLSEWGCWNQLYIEKMFGSILTACGHSPDLVQFCTGYAETGMAVVDAADKILFIGSTGVGRAVQERAAATWTPVTLELGGKDAFVVLDDADVDRALVMAVSAAFFNLGQNCIAAERFIIQQAVYEKFKAGFMKTALTVRQGEDSDSNRCDVGAVLVPGWMERYDAMIRDAKEKGAKILMGGSRDPNRDGLYFLPTVIEGATPDMMCVKEETFGPLAVLMKPARDDDEVLQLLNHPNFGLGLSIFGSQRRALKLAAAAKAGMVGINDFGLNQVVTTMPFGGVGESGHGRFWGYEGLRDFTYLKSVVLDRFEGVAPATPPFMTLPASKNAPSSVGLMLEAFFAANIVAQAIGGLRLAKRLLTKDH